MNRIRASTTFFLLIIPFSIQPRFFSDLRPQLLQYRLFKSLQETLNDYVDDVMESYTAGPYSLEHFDASKKLEQKLEELETTMQTNAMRTSDVVDRAKWCIRDLWFFALMKHNTFEATWLREFTNRLPPVTVPHILHTASTVAKIRSDGSVVTK